MEAIEYFHVNGVFERSINASFISIVHKKESASCIRYYRPISLVGSIYKIISKVLSNRLKKVLDVSISSSQNAFVEGRQILDAALVANELVDSRRKNREADLLCKLDLEKAFDHINWEFLDFIMIWMGFGVRWRGWIKFYIFSVRFSVVINGSLCGFFGSSRGFRQVDLPEAGPAVVSDSMRTQNQPRCKVDFLPTTYLGFPLGASHKDTMAWNSVIERVEKRLARWQKRYLSKGDKEVLIKSTLSSMSTYYLSMLQAPVSIIEKLERFQRNFLWDAADGTRKFYLVNWQTITSPKRWGGLGVKDLRVFNRALLGKWLWRFGVECSVEGAS
uniref:Reverse transcriptase domain-containing protein n=1 Tax=Nicotiana tabacum TaxID=4097 RepID=A0A1S3X0X8_TOBAC|nr:PREDICTED: uncharacterized protein LOC107759971 [Nicotiana tabacum]